jgi:hypothetical protein
MNDFGLTWEFTRHLEQRQGFREFRVKSIMEKAESDVGGDKSNSGSGRSSLDINQHVHTLPEQPEARPEDAEEAALPKVERNGKLYRKKKANLPFLKKHTWSQPTPSATTKSDKQDKDKMEKESSPPIFERTTEVSRTLLRYAVVIVLGTLLLSRAMTETWTFGYQGKWTNSMNWLPRPVRFLSIYLSSSHHPLHPPRLSSHMTCVGRPLTAAATNKRLSQVAISENADCCHLCPLW